VRRFVLLLAAIGCGSGGISTLSIDKIDPPFSPLVGGTNVTISGQGFLADGAPPNHVIIGGTEAPLASAIDDATLIVETPAGTMPGDVDVVVFNQNGTVTATGMFHYSTQPSITAITPIEVLFSTGASVTVTGTGFKDENAGPPVVTLNGQPTVDVMVQSDTQLTFTALPSQPLARPDVQVTNSRGVAVKKSGFRYIPGTNPTLVIFPSRQGSSGGTFVLFYDPIANTTLATPLTNPTSNAAGIHGALKAPNGDLFGINSNNQYGKIDFATQQIVDPITIAGRVNTLAAMGTAGFAVDRNANQFGTFDPTTGSFHPIGARLANCCQAAIATNATTVFLANTGGISTINSATGARGATLTLNPAHGVGEMRFINATLFATDPNGALFTINQNSGATNVITTFNTRVDGLEVFIPGETK
jgi:hypothetical protein